VINSCLAIVKMVQQEMSDNMLSSSCISKLQEEAREVRRKRKKKRTGSTLVASHFLDLYKLTGEVLGRGSCGSVQVCRSIYTSEDYVVKIIEKTPDLCRTKVFKEIEMMHHCKGHNTIIQLVEYFEEEDKFYLVIEKANGGTLLSRVHKNFRLTETEASMIMRDLASALDFLHQKGIAHCDIKLDNILCVNPNQVYPVKICDFDLASGLEASIGADLNTTPDVYTPVGTAEYMAPEVVKGYTSFDSDPYDKRCDLWSLGVCLYFMLCGYHPFTGDCGDENCEWDLGGDCEACQGLLFDSITKCTFEFPDEEWAGISDDAKNLIRQLLNEEPSERLSASKILAHHWVVSGGEPSLGSQLDESLDIICDMQNNFDLNITWPIVCTSSSNENLPSDDVQFDDFESRADACYNWREQMDVENSQIDHTSNARKNSLQCRSSIENWHKFDGGDHSDHKSWRRTPKIDLNAKIDLNDQLTQQLLAHFDTRMKIYELMKEKFKIGSSEAESLIDDLCLLERFQLSPPSSRLAKRRRGRRKNQIPYQSTHLISAC